ncbi:methyl-CpG-binding domain protein 3-like 2B [Vicugna pacos]|uniref:Methyl-CpG-binding domain protein 3-like 2B n=1 Tax=Vicugna pacos TaxID=30538 RepID=A0A6I9I8W3_VICPA
MGEPASTFPSQPLLGKLRRSLMPQLLEKKRKVHLARAKQRQRDRAAFPMRLTSCIFKSPVTRVTSHPGNVVKCRKWEETLEKPQQVCAYRRLQGLQACNPEGEPFSTLESSSSILQMIAAGVAGESLGNAGAGSQPTSPEPITVQSSDGSETAPGLDLFLPQPLCRHPVTYADIRRQSRKVKKARERLAVALRADRLAREMERARSPKECLEN